jgi:hypothetical protein
MYNGVRELYDNKPWAADLVQRANAALAVLSPTPH